MAKPEKEENEKNDFFEELEVDEDSDLPVHEEFVTNKKLRKIKNRE